MRALITQSNFGKSFQRKGRLLEPNKTTLKCYFEFICVKHRLMTTYANPSGLSEKKRLLCRKARYVRSLGKKPNLWPSQRLNKLTGALSCMHKGPKCIQSLWDHPKKIPFVQKHKEGAICAILREKTPFLAFPEAKKGVVNCARLHKAAHWPNNNANPSGLLEKKFIV